MRLPKLTGPVLSGLHCFLIAAEQMSFTRAAEILCLTQSAVSHKIKNLEDSLGVQLFIRQPRKLTLTEEGKRLKMVVAHNFGDIAHEIRDLKTLELSGDFNVAVPPTFAQTWLLPRLKEFLDKYPALRFHLRTRNELIDFQTETFDCAIYFGHGKYGGLHSAKLMDESMLPVCSHDYAVAHDLYGNPDKLSTCMLLHDAAPWARAGRNDEWQYWAQRHGVELPEAGCTFDRADLALQAAERGIGVAMGRKSFIADQFDDERLVAPFAMSVTSPLSYYIVCRKELAQSPRIVAFAEWLRSLVD
ncbi:colanic acid biosynthesis glycosyltransferase WcaA [Photobacterium proteolyticum]|uniref:Colanic acid biosynthesis glycosyltransferase WcaA n=1 Tax=Photobacterium proteolyticum TaxID=1903952 RepID=A0A1Q9GK66_9GAMM|nr:DNA-binding transcriptional regulator DsdC [Photobacterium proteolyticum]OLQ74899.1 colanic acid biosynthesis glycosyltransferase WcaA [Photobacterium proteolyticum]